MSFCELFNENLALVQGLSQQVREEHKPTFLDQIEKTKEFMNELGLEIMDVNAETPNIREGYGRIFNFYNDVVLKIPDDKRGNAYIRFSNMTYCIMQILYNY